MHRIKNYNLRMGFLPFSGSYPNFYITFTLTKAPATSNPGTGSIKFSIDRKDQ